MFGNYEKYTFANKKIRWICLIAILICVLRYLQISLILFNGPKEENLIEGYFVNTSGCHMLALNPFSKQAISHVSYLNSEKCFKPQLLTVQTINGKNYLVLSKTEKEIIDICGVKKVSDVHCEYMTIRPFSDDINNYYDTKYFNLSIENKKIRVESGRKILRVQCFGVNRESVYHDVHFFLPAPAKSPFTKTTSNPDRISVMILGIDSISHMHYLRSMPSVSSTMKYLPHVEFWGYNRVGRNSYPNLVPLFSGLNISELEESCYNGKFNYDSCDFIWKDYKAVGHETIYAEDSKVVGTFNYGKHGFHRKPTDFYLRPIMLEIDTHTRYSIDILENIHCSAGRKYSEVFHEYINKLFPHLKRGRHFSFFWEIQGVHDYFNYAKLLDKDYNSLLKRLRLNHILNDTFVLFMSDHGIRFGSFRSTYQGMLEESQPLLIALYPKWLEKDYPLAISNLQKNAHSLVTTFDLYATLKDLTNLSNLRNSSIEKRSAVLQEKGQQIPRGISLFLPIPEHRDCDSAEIPAQFCLCHKLHQVSSIDARSHQAALFVVECINALISDFSLCQQLELKEVQAAYLLDRGDVQQGFDLKVRLVTSPGDAQFEGTTTITSDSIALNGAILRTNRYANQSYCVQNYQIEMYCYCL